MKTGQIVPAILALLALGACAETTITTGPEGDIATLKDVPEGVIALAAPNQDLTTVRIQPEDGCYWYRYSGPVETTYLPLRARDGRPICSRAPETAQTSG
ncbi:hypothetical protein [Aliiruegeria lutimaris]|uniref:Lipoprotein n=1 Tax=Aliiruegeria lutimaris TaxID=571298 RepID=A0A1G8LEU9_9RHOB|nr:hypothetical protein [Aliiruegeria lutimaris]SDI54219.1 hypothetical protein SAMN04488026_100431 [Aliiruegeria lutimaris]